jgi:hypothetical protein
MPSKPRDAGNSRPWFIPFLVVPKKEGLCKKVRVTDVRMVRLCNRSHNVDGCLCVAISQFGDSFGLVFRASLPNFDYWRITLSRYSL